MNIIRRAPFERQIWVGQLPKVPDSEFNRFQNSNAEEGNELIRQAGGTINRIDEAHAGGGVSDHVYPHINCTTPSDAKATLRVESVK